MRSLRLILDSVLIIAKTALEVNRFAADYYFGTKVAELLACCTPYFFVYCAAKTVCRKMLNGLDFPVEESYNPNAPGERQICRIPQERFHTTTCLTTTPSGGRENSGEKSAGEQVFRTKQRQM